MDSFTRSTGLDRDTLAKVIHYTLNWNSLFYISENIYGHISQVGAHRFVNDHRQQLWLVRHKILHALSEMSFKTLEGVIEIDEKYFREVQKGSDKLISFADRRSSRRPRYHQESSESGIYGPEFICVLSAADHAGHYWAKCVSLGACDVKALKHLEPYLKDVKFICSDAYEIYKDWCDKHNYPHYIEPSGYRKKRQQKGYKENPQTEEQKRRNLRIMKEMSDNREGPYVEGATFEEFSALRKQFNLGIEFVNSFHQRLEELFVNDTKGVSSKYLQEYVGAFVYVHNWQSEHGYPPSTLNDAYEILDEIEQYSALNLRQIKSQSVLDLPHKSKRFVRNKEKDVRDQIRTHTIDLDTIKPIEYFKSLGVKRVNDLVRTYLDWRQGETKLHKCKRLATMPDVERIIEEDYKNH